ncbi:bicarbonate transport system permease protein CmpB [mine drainage metagenome]|uniref:Bicarbonate transport system permease protein CmpB n=1 Tax=mine drainage metagenome TaxID=410659 RepID=A0A1J5SCT8_9ZZZZ
MNLLRRLIAFCETTGLTLFVPVLRLCLGEEPRRQLGALGRIAGLPLVGAAVFLLAWSAVASDVKTSIGALPGPVQVWEQAEGLVKEHLAERARERAFYARQAEIKVRYEKAFPGRHWAERKYSGAPTYLDEILTSLETVFAGFLIASAIAIPIGILCGLSETFFNTVNPYIQLFRPVSPLAWLPIVMILVSALYTSKDPLFAKSFVSSAITVALCSLWPTLVNTAIGVGSIDPDHLNVARVLRLSWWVRLRKIVLPSALPFIFTGLRLSLSVGWMVLIAAEMLAQNPGLGKFVWDMFQNGSSQTLALIMVAVFTIGIIGFILDRLMLTLQQLVSYERSAKR